MRIVDISCSNCGTKVIMPEETFKEKIKKVAGNSAIMDFVPVTYLEFQCLKCWSMCCVEIKDENTR